MAEPQTKPTHPGIDDEEARQDNVGASKVPQEVDTGQKQSPEFGAGAGPAQADRPGEPDVEPGIGGYDDRDPSSEMPRIPTVPDTQQEAASHKAAPGNVKSYSAHTGSGDDRVETDDLPPPRD